MFILIGIIVVLAAASVAALLPEVRRDGYGRPEFPARPLLP
ncbi:hypothetical protein [Agromyces seonyuensis]|nr:hypothetical protein [Agromyces seonyuensis]